MKAYESFKINQQSARFSQITSQNPYAEVFVGKPFVQTVDIHNLTEVEEALKEIINTEVGIGTGIFNYEVTTFLRCSSPKR